MEIKKSWFVASKEGNIKDDYTFEKKLGSGGYGAVYLGYNKKSNQAVAVKAIQKAKVRDVESFRNEVEILRNLDHPNIIQLYETWESDRICFLVMEVCNGGELFYYITKNKKLTERDASEIFKQAFSAMVYLHKNNICHRDIKPENFLLKKSMDVSNIKLIDFGLAKKVEKGEAMNLPNGTPFYIAPEVLSGDY
jgi:calcium-dependent protein kinase